MTDSQRKIPDHTSFIHAGRKDWRDGGKPLCGIGPMGWCYLAPSIEEFWKSDYYRRCPSCEALTEVRQKLIPEAGDQDD